MTKYYVTSATTDTHGVVGHKKDIVVGRARLPFSPEQNSWAIPGRTFIRDSLKAKCHCQKMSELMV